MERSRYESRGVKHGGERWKSNESMGVDEEVERSGGKMLQVEARCGEGRDVQPDKAAERERVKRVRSAGMGGVQAAG